MKNNLNEKILKEKDFNLFSAKLLYKTFKRLSKNKKNVYVALSGGSTPLPILNILKNYDINWNYFNFFLVDERNVPSTSSLSNYGNIEKVFFNHIKSSCYSMTNSNYSIDECAVNYEKLICSKIPVGENNIPVFDLILLGMGTDGHTASLFPKTKGLLEKTKFIIVNSVPQLNTKRITLTYPIILNANKIMIFAKGNFKSKILNEIKMGGGDIYPIAKIINSKVDITCITGVN